MYIYRFIFTINYIENSEHYFFIDAQMKVTENRKVIGIWDPKFNV